jgi:hypothetical protein
MSILNAIESLVREYKILSHEEHHRTHGDDPPHFRGAVCVCAPKVRTSKKLILDTG